MKFTTRIDFPPEFSQQLGVALDQVENKALEIRRFRNVHRWTAGRMSLAATADTITPGPEELIQYVVFVRGEYQPRDRQAHLLRNPTRQDVAEIAGGYCERHLLLARPCRRQIAFEVVDDLRDNPAP